MNLHKKTHIAYVAFAVFFCFAIGFVSISRVGLIQIRPKITSMEYRNMLIATKSVYADELEPSVNSYSLPEPGMLPTNPFYGFKALRDWLWLKITIDPVEKTKLLQYMADKKMSEATAMLSDSKIKPGYIAVEESYNYLELTLKSVSDIKENKDQQQQLRLHAIDAGKAYIGIINNFASSLTSSEYDKKDEWLVRFNEWNAKFEENN